MPRVKVVESPTSQVEVRDARAAARAVLLASVDSADVDHVARELTRHAWSLDADLHAALEKFDRASRKRPVPERDKADVEKNRRIAAAKARAGEKLMAIVKVRAAALSRPLG